jgi:hypothetical protein
MNYTEYLNQPGIKGRFNLKYNELKDYFQKRFEKLGISKEQNDLLSTKVAFLDADYFFSEQFASENKTDKKAEPELNNN